MLAGEAIVLPATSLAAAEALFAAHQKDVAIILWDGCLPDGMSLPLITRIRTSGFGGPMIACSTGKDLVAAMLAAGCDRAVPKSAAVTAILAALRDSAV